MEARKDLTRLIWSEQEIIALNDDPNFLGELQTHGQFSSLLARHGLKLRRGHDGSALHTQRKIVQKRINNRDHVEREKC